MYYRPTFLIKK